MSGARHDWPLEPAGEYGAMAYSHILPATADTQQIAQFSSTSKVTQKTNGILISKEYPNIRRSASFGMLCLRFAGMAQYSKVLRYNRELLHNS
jgi:hypothetical protein